MYKVQLVVRPRKGVRDPQGEAVEEALRGLGYDGLQVDCVGRYLALELEAQSEAAAKSLAEDMCKRLLVNPSLETYELTIESA